MAIFDKVEMNFFDFLVKSKWGRPRFIYPAIASIGFLLIAIGTESLNVGVEFYSLVFKFLAKKFIEEVGVAFVISSLVGATVEIYNLRRHEKDIQEGDERHMSQARAALKVVAERAAQEGVLSVFRGLSPLILGAAQKHVLDSTITREEYKISVEFQKKDVFLEVTTTVRFILRNSVDRDCEYKYCFAFEPELSGARKNNPKPVYLKLGSEIFNALPELESAGLIKRNGSAVQAVSKDIRVPMKGRVETVITFVEERALEDTVYWVTMLPCDKLSLTVSPCSGLAYYVVSLHPEEAEQQAGAHASNMRTWEVNRGLLPGQGILLKWRCN